MNETKTAAFVAFLEDNEIAARAATQECNGAMSDYFEGLADAYGVALGEFERQTA